MQRDLAPVCGRTLEGLRERRLVALRVAVVRVVLANEEETGRGRSHPLEQEGRIPPGERVQQERPALAQPLGRTAHDARREPPERRREASDAEEIDVVRERDQEALAAGVAAPLELEPEPRGELGDPRSRWNGRRQWPAVLVELGFALVRQRQ